MNQANRRIQRLQEQLRSLNQQLAEHDHELSQAAASMPMSSIRSIAQRGCRKSGQHTTQHRPGQRGQSHSPRLANGSSEHASSASGEVKATTNDLTSHGSLHSAGSDRASSGFVGKHPDLGTGELQPASRSPLRESADVNALVAGSNRLGSSKLHLRVTTSPRSQASSGRSGRHAMADEENVTPSTDSSRAYDEQYNVLDDEDEESDLYR